jgi:hypothetical protein
LIGLLGDDEYNLSPKGEVNVILTKNPNQKQKVLPIEVKNKIVEAIHGLRFGTVSIIVQDGHVIQIEKLEKERVK